MPIKVEANNTQLNAAKETLSGLGRGLRDDSAAMKEASIFLNQWVLKNFQSQGGNVGGWEPFMYGGRVGKKGVNPSARLLQDTGHLRMSFLPFSSKGNAGIGSDLPYSQFHEEGTATLPQRRMLPSPQEVDVDIVAIFDRFVNVEIRKANRD